MKTNKNRIRFTLLTFAVAFSTLQANCQESIAISDFSDASLEDWTLIDVNGETPWGPGIVEVRDSRLNLDTTGPVPPGEPPSIVESGLLLAAWNGSVDPQFSNGYLTGIVRVDTQSNANLFLRGELTTLTGYVFNATGSDSTETSMHEFGIFRYINGEETLLGTISEPDFGVAQDWMMEAGAVGSQLSLKVWPAGSDEPALPQLTVTDDSIATGLLGVTSAINRFRIESPTVIRTSYDELTFEAVPEPSSSLLLLVALAGIGVCRRKGMNCKHTSDVF